MPGLIRGVARTAAVVGTAGAVNHHQQQKWAAKDQQAAQAAAYQQQQYAPPPQQYARRRRSSTPAAAGAGGGPDGGEDQPVGRAARAGDPQRRGVRLGQGQGAGHLAHRARAGGAPRCGGRHPLHDRESRAVASSASRPGGRPGTLEDEGRAHGWCGGARCSRRARVWVCRSGRGSSRGRRVVGRSFSRGLMPRTTSDQAIITGVSSVLNYGLTATSQSLIEAVAFKVAGQGAGHLAAADDPARA